MSAAPVPYTELTTSSPTHALMLSMARDEDPACVHYPDTLVRRYYPYMVWLRAPRAVVRSLAATAALLELEL